ncbi:LysR substrate-binding domain-containing protein [Clostridium fallax]|uniref:DNA-binding transcriptional regulator, LysR family n=1 Tax=Clostridium fallax TaxID=1533 RepID=A0A1M4T5M9_9CLOT|nr:LysR substrate-binding domain-containing protein [Clostridium fallax]SHE39759.1 DNA-binding transcriptional regulator, LysR family [Clostridium fallax]SQB22608.1 LysR family transcriptional regulator [Clostridium fallax]
MNERKLKIYYEVATSLNMTKVAERMFISQPSISQAIKEIEEEMDCIFFERLGKKLYLTYEGEVFLSYARRILNLMEESKCRIKSFKNIEAGYISIGASTTIGVHLLPSIVRNFSKEYPMVDISLEIKNTDEIVNMILDNTIDLGLIEGEVNLDELIINDFYIDELVFIAPLEHHWKDKKYLDKTDFNDETLILRENGSGTRMIVERALKNKGIIYNTHMEIGHNEAIKKLVKNGFGVSCISKLCIEKDEEKDFIIRRMKDGKIIRNFYLVYHKDKFISKLLNIFLQYVKEKSLFI